MPRFCVQNHYDYKDEYEVEADFQFQAGLLADTYAVVIQQPRPWTREIAALAGDVLEKVVQTADKEFVAFIDSAVHQLEAEGRSSADD